MRSNEQPCMAPFTSHARCVPPHLIQLVGGSPTHSLRHDLPPTPTWMAFIAFVLVAIESTAAHTRAQTGKNHLRLSPPPFRAKEGTVPNILLSFASVPPVVFNHRVNLVGLLRTAFHFRRASTSDALLRTRTLAKRSHVGRTCVQDGCSCRLPRLQGVGGGAGAARRRRLASNHVDEWTKRLTGSTATSHERTRGRGWMVWWDTSKHVGWWNPSARGTPPTKQVRGPRPRVDCPIRA